MSQYLLLNGSVPLKTVEDVMRRFGGALGPYLPAIPDGEVGERKSWVLRLSYQRWSHFLRQPAKVDLTMTRTIHHEDTQTVHG
jgi:hypothetical protein